VGVYEERLPEQLVCPNCGFRSLDLAKAMPQPAQRVRVDQESKAKGRSRRERWDVVAVRASGDRPAMVKRVIGLPGESIHFDGGDVFVDGLLAQKPLGIARSMRVPVFDSRFSSADVLRRFQPIDGAEGWRAIDGVWKYSPSVQVEKKQWLAYEQWRCVSSSQPRDDAVSVEDWYATNVNLNRNLNTTRDIWAEFDLRVPPSCQLDLAVNLGSGFHTFEIDFGAGRVLSGLRNISFDTQALKSRSTIKPNAQGEIGTGLQLVSIEVCTFDQRLVLLINGQAVDAIELPSFEAATELHSPVRIAGRSTDFVIERFQLWRDIYYSDVGMLDSEGVPRRLVAGADEYLLVGDNVPVSVDSRHWAVPGVSVAEILGSVQPVK